MALFLTATAIVLAAAVAVLFVPIAVDVSVAKEADDTRIDSRIRIRWLGLTIPVRRTPSKRKRSTAAERTRAARGWPAIRALLLSPGFVARCVRLLGDLTAVARPRQLQLYAHVGFDDPSDTGALLGWMGAGWKRDKRHRIHIEPDFGHEVLTGRLHVNWSLSVARVTWPVLRFALSPVVWRAVRNYRAQRTREKISR